MRCGALELHKMLVHAPQHWRLLVLGHSLTCAALSSDVASCGAGLPRVHSCDVQGRMRTAACNVSMKPSHHSICI